MKSTIKLLVAIAVGISISLGVSPVFAQDGFALEEVVVQKQDLPPVIC